MEKRDWFGKKSVRNLKCTMSMDFFVYYFKTPMNVCQNIICKTYIKMGIAIHPHQSKGNRVKANGKKTQCKKRQKSRIFCLDQVFTLLPGVLKDGSSEG